MSVQSRFRQASEEDLDDLLKGSESASTKRTISKAVHTFQEYLAENGIKEEIETMTPSELPLLISAYLY